MTETKEHNDEQTQGPLIGTVIRKAREQRNVSVKIVAQHTKISSTNLEALEANDFSKLPNKAYVKGYVKSCAKLLALDTEECLRILQENYDTLNYSSRVQAKIKEEKVKEEQENSQLIFKMIGVVAIVLIFVMLISDSDKKTDKTTEKIDQTETTEEEVAAAEDKKDSKSQVITPLVLSNDTPLKAEATPTPAPTPEPTPVATPTPKVADADKDKKKEEIDLRPIRGTLYGFDESITPEQFDEWMPSNFRAEIVEGKQNVFISAFKGDTWLTYQVDGGEIKKFILKEGQKLFVQGEEVLLFLGNFNATKIFLNNRLLSVSSRSGVKSLVFPQEKASSHFYPLFIYKDDGSVLNSKTYNAKKNEEN